MYLYFQSVKTAQYFIQYFNLASLHLNVVILRFLFKLFIF